MAPLPQSEQIRVAIDVYMSIAYPASPPARLGTTLQTIASCQGDLLDCQAFVKSESPTRYLLRLGNSFYPHMKMAVEQSPNQSQWLFRVDTHDRHVCPKDSSPEYGAFCQLMANNQKLAEEIEAAWEQQGVPTFKAFLREDLKRRMAAR